ncbi:MAG: DMT family transporter [Motiliproteus sp.]
MTVNSTRVAFILMLLVCLIWGAEYVLVDLAIEVLPTHSFNTIRFTIAALSLLPLLWFSKEKIPDGKHLTLLGTGSLLGLLLFIGFYTQTEGLLFTSVSNAGFITALVVPLVPLLGLILLGIKRPLPVWIGVACATIGLYYLTIGDNLEFNKGDLLVLICAFAFSLHIIITGKVVGNLPIIPLSLIQLTSVAIYSGIAALLSSGPLINGHSDSVSDGVQLLLSPIIISALLVAGILGSGFATWAQASSQRLLQPHQIALIFASEPIFAWFFAWLFLGEKLGTQGIIGAGMIIIGMLISELGDRSPKGKKSKRGEHTVKVKPLEHLASSD